MFAYYDCSIKILRLTHSHNNSISNCEIEDSMNYFSRGNKFKDLKFAEKFEKYLKDLLKSSFGKKSIFYRVFVSYYGNDLWNFSPLGVWTRSSVRFLINNVFNDSFRINCIPFKLPKHEKA